MKAHRLLDARTLGVLSGRASLGLPTFSGVGYPASPPTGPSRQAALPVHLDEPDGWDPGAIDEGDIVAAIDDSSSMYGQWGDPRGVRRAAALSVVQLMARSPRARVGVVHWGSNAPEHLALALTPVRQRRRIEAGLTIPPPLGGTNIASALDRSSELLQTSGDSRMKLVIVITDGIEAVGPAAAEQIRRLPTGSVHVLLVDHSHGCSPDLEAGWSALPLGSFTRLNLLDTHCMGTQIAHIVANAASARTPLPATTPPNPRS